MAVDVGSYCDTAHMTAPIPPLFDDTPPSDRAWVLEQGIEFNPERWKRAIPDTQAWPAELDDCPASGRWPIVDRHRVFAVSGRVSCELDQPWAATQLLVAALAWGVGTSALDVGRRAKVFADTDLNSKLTRAIKVLRVEGPVSAYSALSRGGSLAVKNLGPSFFTKFLYFAGYDTDSYMPKPVILDQHVARALNAYTTDEWSTAGPWSPQQYGKYLDLVADWASRWDTSQDSIERRLFRRGRQLAKPQP
ncbi:8-oxoguanine DNA glycosylase OGG fold protein [Prescottella equi]|uniref:8-oxoguanine DNA glycosylase OGG fold protein n=1 Tax=Rhodococcus hoagii TaxID=43767 RepID=UPI000B144CDD|nr:hypothetical protein [Prescottella equi]